MARRRPVRDGGTLAVLEHRSSILGDDPPGDPHVSDVDDRMDSSLPFLYRALRP